MKEKNESPIKGSNQSSEINDDTDLESVIKQCYKYSNMDELFDLLTLIILN